MTLRKKWRPVIVRALVHSPASICFTLPHCFPLPHCFTLPLLYPPFALPSLWEGEAKREVNAEGSAEGSAEGNAEGMQREWRHKRVGCDPLNRFRQPEAGHYQPRLHHVC